MQVELKQTCLWPGFEDLLSSDSETVVRNAYPLLCNHSSYVIFPQALPFCLTMFLFMHLFVVLNLPLPLCPWTAWSSRREMLPLKI